MEKFSVFVSKPNDLARSQQSVWEDLEILLHGRGLAPRSIGSTDFPNVPPLAAVVNVMKHCHGAIILGFRQVFVAEGVFKPGTNKERPVRGVFFPTPWNHIEAGIAYQLGLPLLVIREAGMSGGVFDIGSTGGYIHQFDLSATDWMESEKFLQPFNEWYADVLRHTDH